MIPRSVAYAALAAAAALVFALFLNGNGGPGLVPPWDKAAHFGYFFVLTVTLWLGLRGRVTWPILALVVVIGGVDEVRQMYLPARQASWADLAADVLAGVVALTLLARAARTRRLRAGAAFAAERYGGK